MANLIKIPNLLLYEKNISLLFLTDFLHDKEHPQTTGARHTRQRAEVRTQTEQTAKWPQGRRMPYQLTLIPHILQT